MLTDVLTQYVNQVINMERLLAAYGSMRLLMEAYWKGRLSKSEEQFLEDHTPPEIRIGMKPIC